MTKKTTCCFTEFCVVVVAIDPWGSGGNAEQNHRSFMGMVQDFRNQGMSETEIAKAFDISTADLRSLKTIAKNQIKAG